MIKSSGAVRSLLGAVSALAICGAAHAGPTGAGIGVAGARLTGMAATALNDKTAVVAPALGSASVNFEVFLPLRNEAALDALIEQQQNSKSASYHKWLTPAQFGAQFGPSAASIANVKAALSGAGLQVSATHTRSVSVTGTVASVNRAFGVSLQNVTPRAGGARLVAKTGLVMPAALQSEGAMIVSFNGLPPKHVNSKVVATHVPDNRNSDHGGYYFTDLREAYNFPAYNAPLGNGQLPDGTGANVAVLMSSNANVSDVTAAFDHEKFSTVSGKPDPSFNHVAINGGGGLDGGAFLEASLDVQEVLGGAPGANVTLVDIPTLNDYDIIGGYLFIVEENAYDIVNSSFGGCELSYTAAYNGGQDYTGVLQVYDTLFKQGNSQGITFVASSGDEGGLECPDTNYGTGNPSVFIKSVSFPADSPHVTAVGGGNLVTTTPPSPQTSPPTLTSLYVTENANGDPEVPYDPYGYGQNVSGGYWGAGGGRSQIFTAPSYQALVATGSKPKRTVPDVGMQVGGCPGGISQLPCGPERSYVIIYGDGNRYGLIGTSVSSPEFVGAAALYIQKNGRQGNLNYYLYAQSAIQGESGAIYYNQGIPGFDGAWSNTSTPAPNYTYLYGNGSPKVRRLFGFTDLPHAGDPQTPSNP